MWVLQASYALLKSPNILQKDKKFEGKVSEGV